MSKLLVHVTCGPEAPTRAALGFLVAMRRRLRGTG
jgi:hypothetical protein